MHQRCNAIKIHHTKDASNQRFCYHHMWIPKRHLFCVDQVAQISPGRPQMPKIGQKCPQIHNFLCIFISLYLSAFIFISLHLSAFLYTSWHFSAFLSIFLHFSTANLGISLHFSPFLCIFLQTSAFHWHGRGDQCCSTIFVTLIIV